MKKNRMMRLASILLVCVLLTTSVISGTFAKYTSTVTGSDTARVAKWHIEVNDTEISVATPAINFNLFNTVLDTNGGQKERNVAEGVGDEVIIAPGTKGSFELVIENGSEVTAEYGIEFKVLENSDNIPVQFSVDNQNWYMDIEELNIQTDASHTTQIGRGKDDTVKVYWKWAFEADAVTSVGDLQTDKKDTDLGIDAADLTTAPSITVQATITVDQVD